MSGRAPEESPRKVPRQRRFCMRDDGLLRKTRANPEDRAIRVRLFSSKFPAVSLRLPTNTSAQLACVRNACVRVVSLVALRASCVYELASQLVHVNWHHPLRCCASAGMAAGGDELRMDCAAVLLAGCTATKLHYYTVLLRACDIYAAPYTITSTHAPHARLPTRIRLTLLRSSRPGHTHWPLQRQVRLAPPGTPVQDADWTSEHADIMLTCGLSSSFSRNRV